MRTPFRYFNSWPKVIYQGDALYLLPALAAAGRGFACLRSYGATAKEIGAKRRQVYGRWLNNRGTPISRSASIYDHFSHDRRLNRRRRSRQGLGGAARVAEPRKFSRGG